jgi:hypothetical protein
MQTVLCIFVDDWRLGVSKVFHSRHNIVDVRAVSVPGVGLSIFRKFKRVRYLLTFLPRDQATLDQGWVNCVDYFFRKSIFFGIMACCQIS